MWNIVEKASLHFYQGCKYYTIKTCLRLLIESDVHAYDIHGIISFPFRPGFDGQDYGHSSTSFRDVVSGGLLRFAEFYAIWT